MVALVTPRPDARTLGSRRRAVVRLGTDPAAGTTQGLKLTSTNLDTERVVMSVCGVGYPLALQKPSIDRSRSLRNNYLKAKLLAAPVSGARDVPVRERQSLSWCRPKSV